jgi:hypothetical protein
MRILKSKRGICKHCRVFFERTQVGARYCGQTFCPRQFDFSVRNHGSVILLYPKTDAAKEWISEHIPEDAQRWGLSVVVEPRYVMDILAGARADGLRVSWNV